MSDSSEEQKQALEVLTEKNGKKGVSPNLQYCYAMTIEKIAERADVDPSKSIKDSSLDIERAIEEIEKAIISKAVEEHSKAKYYAVKANLLTYRNTDSDDLIAARKSINKAISLLQYDSIKGSIHALKFQYISNRIGLLLQAKEHSEEMKSQINVLTTQFSILQKERVKSIEIIGIFSAIVSFIVVSVTIANSSSDLHSSFLLIVTLIGALLIVFGTFSMLLHWPELVDIDRNKREIKKKLSPQAKVLLVGCIMVVSVGILLFAFL